MSIIDTLACGFAAVAVSSIIRGKAELQKKIRECEKELKIRKLKHKFERYKVLFNFVKFDTECR